MVYLPAASTNTIELEMYQSCCPRSLPCVHRSTSGSLEPQRFPPACCQLRFIRCTRSRWDRGSRRSRAWRARRNRSDRRCRRGCTKGPDRPDESEHLVGCCGVADANGPRTPRETAIESTAWILPGRGSEIRRSPIHPTPRRVFCAANVSLAPRPNNAPPVRTAGAVRVTWNTPALLT